MLKEIGAVDSVKIVALLDNSPKYDSYYKSGFGFCLWVEVKSGHASKRILFDVGHLPDSIQDNAKKLKIDLKEVDMIVISHCHFDHCGSLSELLPVIGHEIPIFAHPEVFKPSFVLKPEFMNYGLVGKNNKESLERLGGFFILTKSPFELFPGVIFSGEIDRTTSFEETGGVSCYTIDAEGNIVVDKLMDDLSLAINVKNKGLVILTGCAHAGIVNTVKHFTEISGVSEFEGIMGGFHLLESNQERVRLTIDEIKRHNPCWVSPMHCTGNVAIGKFAHEFKEKYREIAAGDSVFI